MNKGFTLVEILVAVMITAILITMAVPIYDKTIEKSRISEARVVLKQLLEAKLRMLDAADKETYSPSYFGFENLEFAIPCVSSTSSNGHKVTCSTKAFKFVLNPSGTVYGSTDKVTNAVCAVRLGGDNKGTTFLFLGELETDADNDKFLCNKGTNSSDTCEAYGLTSTGSAWCS